jgi:hypothetical protein
MVATCRRSFGVDVLSLISQLKSPGSPPNSLSIVDTS